MGAKTIKIRFSDGTYITKILSDTELNTLLNEIESGKIIELDYVGKTYYIPSTGISYVIDEGK
jgi:hypothetical protein